MSERTRNGVGTAACLALAAAAGLHLAVLPEHTREGLLLGMFFLVTAVLQFVAAAVVVNGVSRRAGWVIVAGNLLVLGIWIVSRTAGIPIGPDAGRPEPVAWLDSLSGIVELVAIAGTLSLMERRALVGAGDPVVVGAGAHHN